MQEFRPILYSQFTFLAHHYNALEKHSCTNSNRNYVLEHQRYVIRFQVYVNHNKKERKI